MLTLRKLIPFNQYHSMLGVLFDADDAVDSGEGGGAKFCGACGSSLNILIKLLASGLNCAVSIDDWFKNFDSNSITFLRSSWLSSLVSIVIFIVTFEEYYRASIVS